MVVEGECEYCGGEVRIDSECRGCGALHQPDWTKSEPFEHEGFIVYAITNLATDAIEFCFYRGRHLEHKVIVSRLELYENVDMGDTVMPFVMEKLERIEQRC